MRLPLALLLAALPAAASAQDGGAMGCAVTASSAVIRVAICAADGSDAQLAAFGRAACAAARPCGVWFWTDAGSAPAQAPENHDGVTKAQVGAALGVFLAEQDMVVRTGAGRP